MILTILNRLKTLMVQIKARLKIKKMGCEYLTI